MNLSYFYFPSVIYIFSHFFSVRNIFFWSMMKLLLNFKYIMPSPLLQDFREVNCSYTMCGRSDSKYTWPLYLRSLFSLTKNNPFGKTSDIMVKHEIYWKLLCEILPLILQDSSFPYIIAIFF